jgi:HAD superfamily phosphatase (TIGR01668 family)
MAGRYHPNEYLKSIYDIKPEALLEKGIKNLIIDIDNTLSEWGAKRPGMESCSWIDGMRHKGFKICILSNSSNKRIKAYCAGIDVLFVENVRKPMKSSFRRAMAVLGSAKNDTCVIGDQVFTDIAGGNSCGMHTILVQPVDKNEFFFTRLMRKLEKRIIKKYMDMESGNK